MPLSPEQQKAVEAVLAVSGNPEFPVSLAQCILEKNNWNVDKACAYVRDTPINEIIMTDLRDRFDFTPSVCRGVVRDTNGKPIEAWKILNPSEEQALEDHGFLKFVTRLAEMFPSVDRKALERVLKESDCNFDVALDRCLEASSEGEKIAKDKQRGVSHPKPNYLVQEFVVIFEREQKNREEEKKFMTLAKKSARRAETGEAALSKMKEDKKRLAAGEKTESKVKVVCVDKKKAAEATRIAIEAVAEYSARVNKEAKVDVAKKVEDERKARAEQRAKEKKEREERAAAERKAKIEALKKKRAEEAAKKAAAEKKAREEEAAAKKKAKEEAEKKAKEEAEKKAKEEEEEAAKKKAEEEAKVEQMPIVIASTEDNNVEDDYDDGNCDEDIEKQLMDDAPEETAEDGDDGADDYSDSEVADDVIEQQNEGEAVEPSIEVVTAAIEGQEAEVKKAVEEKEKYEKRASEFKSMNTELDNIRKMREKKQAEKAAKAADGIIYGCQLTVTADEADKEKSKSKYVVHVKWEMERQILPQSSDWIGIYLYNREFSNKYETYSYTNGCNEGTLDLYVDYPGCYDVRFFRKGEEETGRSAAFYVGKEMPLTVENKVTSAVVSWNKELVSSPDDWFGVFPVGQHSNRYPCLDKYYNVKDFMEAGQAEVELPRTPGKYEIRYFYYKSHGWGLGTPSYPFSGRSEPIEVVKRDYVSVVSYGQKVIVDWGIFSEPYSGWNYVSIHEDSDLKSKSLAFVYIGKSEFTQPVEGQPQNYDSGKIGIDMSRVSELKELIEAKKKEQDEQKKKAKEAGEKYEPSEIVFTSEELPDVCKCWEVRVYTPNNSTEPLVSCPFYATSQ